MKFINAIIRFFKKTGSFIKGLLKGKSLSETVAEVAKTATAVATACVAMYTIFNSIKVHTMRSKKNADSNTNEMSGIDYTIQKSKDGVFHKRFNTFRSANAKIGTKVFDDGGSPLLTRIASGRNETFRTLSSKDQLEVLYAEGFDFAAFQNAEKLAHSHNIFNLKERRRAKEYLALHGFKEYDTKKIKKCKMVHQPIKLFADDYFPNVPISNTEDLVEYSKIHAEYQLRKTLDINTDVTGVCSPRDAILADEVFRTDDLNKFRRRVDKRMKNDLEGRSTVFEMMAKNEELKKKKKKKNKDNDSGSSLEKYGIKSKDKKKKKEKDDPYRDANSAVIGRSYKMQKFDYKSL